MHKSQRIISSAIFLQMFVLTAGLFIAAMAINGAAGAPGIG